MNEIGNWVSVIALIVAGLLGMLVRYKFILRSECDKIRHECQQAQCRKLDIAEKAQNKTTDNLARNDREISITLNEIKQSVSNLSESLARLETKFEMLYNKIKS